MPDYVALRHDPYSSHQLVLDRARGAQQVLDVGCSAGVLARDLVAQGSVVDGIEYDPSDAKEARTVCREVLVGDLETMEIALQPGTYDVVLCADIIEHLKDPVAALARLRPLLKPDGRLIVSVPNIANWSMRVTHLLGRWDYQDRGLMDRTHLHFFTQRTIRTTLERAGYRVEQVEVSCPLPVLRREPFTRAAHWLALRRKNLLAYQFIVTGRPAVIS